MEKPDPQKRRPHSALTGRYILQPEIFNELDKKQTGAGGEIQLTDAMANMIGQQAFHGFRFAGERHDCGHALGFLKANIAFALDRDDLGDEVRDFIKGIKT